MAKLRFKRVLRVDRRARMIRLFRVLWQTGVVGDGRGYSAKLSFAIQAKLFQFERSFGEWLLVFCGLRIHRVRSYGGIIR